MDRRHVIGSSLAAGLTGLFARDGEAAQRSGENDTLVAGAIGELRRSLEAQFEACTLGPCSHIDAIRQQQRVFLRASAKYPDFIEVGIDVWEHVYDWHVRNRQPIAASRLADGRYAMTFMFTRLLLRPDQNPQYVGFGFDGDAVRGGAAR